MVNLTITLFSWCLLLVMMVMMALCMNNPSARIPVRLGNDDLQTARIFLSNILIGFFQIPGKGDVLLTGDITELSIDSPPVLVLVLVAQLTQVGNELD